MIQDVQVVDLTTNVDDRGFLTEIARVSNDPEPHGIVHKFGQAYVVGNSEPHVIRAFHVHQEMWDWYYFVTGSAKVVLIDDRNDSPTRHEQMTIIAHERKPRVISIPPGVWHGWMSLEPNTILVSIASETYERDPEKRDEIRLDAFHFGNVWEVKAR